MEIGQTMYSIRINQRQKQYITVMLRQQIDETNLTVFVVQFRKLRGKWKIVNRKYSNSKKLVERPWANGSFEHIAHEMLKFFLETKHTASKNWNEFWYYRIKSNKHEYTLYGCSKYFLKWNFEKEASFDKWDGFRKSQQKK